MSDGEVAQGAGRPSFGPDEVPGTAFSDLVAPLFERAPRFIGRLTEGRPYGSWEGLFAGALATALAMPRDEQRELIDAHPRIGAPAGSVSALSYVEQGYDQDSASAEAEIERERIAGELQRLNEAYEARFGFRYVIFVAGRPRAAIVPLLAAALGADIEAERRRAIADVVAIAQDRARRAGLVDHGVGVTSASGHAGEVDR
jgi:2-oxo-4-hydroxy-4-carboxy-5-ureidoimidazoline decarboxylase